MAGTEIYTTVSLVKIEQDWARMDRHGRMAFRITYIRLAE
jgi:hypothetical protein